jgi:hypothetical protein
VPTRLFRVVCFLILAGFSYGRTTPGVRTSPGRKPNVGVTFVNAGLLSASQQDQIAKSLREKDARAAGGKEARDFSGWTDEAAERVRMIYLNEGYFKVQVVGKLTPTPKNNADRRVAIVVTVLTAGQQYRLSELHWKNTVAFSEQELLDLVPIHSGDIFSRSKVAKGLDQVRSLYQSHGYLNFVCIPNTVFDEAAGTISLEIDVDEGAAFHWGDLQIAGMREADKRELLRAWEAQRGQVYTGDPKNVLDKFLETYFRPLRPGVTPSDFTSWKIDEQSRTVDVYLSLILNPSLLKYSPKPWRGSAESDKSNP